MKTDTPRLRAAFALASLALLSTVGICGLGYLRYCILGNHPVPVAVPVPEFALRLAYSDHQFTTALSLHLGAVLLSSAGALWLAFKR